MLTVYHLNESRSTRVLWLLEELDVPYEVVRFSRDATRRAPPELAESGLADTVRAAGAAEPLVRGRGGAGHEADDPREQDGEARDSAPPALRQVKKGVS